MTEIQNPKLTQDIEKRVYRNCFGHWTLEFEICL